MIPLTEHQLRLLGAFAIGFLLTWELSGEKTL